MHYKAFVAAKTNYFELEKVLIHYYFANDKEKEKATTYLIDNMRGHGYYYSNAIYTFSKIIQRSNSVINENELNNLWDSLSISSNAHYIKDIQSINRNELISNLDFSFKVWRNSPWKKDVPFNTFCNYILPYRIYNEPTIINWKKTLYNKYYNKICKIKDLRKAFAIIHNIVNEEIKKTNINYPYQFNINEIQKIKKGSCLQRCVYEAAVMRSLGIPVTIDGIDFWSNYSQNGHTWVALIGTDGIYTVASKDSIARKKNPIHSSLFPIKSKLPRYYPYDYTFKKKYSKIIRIGYSINNYTYGDTKAPKYVQNIFTRLHVFDVSIDYGVTSSVRIKDKQELYCYLCTYKTSCGWTPIAYTKKKNGFYKFTELGDSVIYLPVIYKNKNMIPITSPFILIGEKTFGLRPNFLSLQKIKINRKYPLVGNFINGWNEMIGGKIEGSNSKKFISPKLLYKIRKTPIYRNLINISIKNKFRYIRYISPTNKKVEIAELYLINNNKHIYGKPFSSEVEQIEKCVDKDESSMPKIIKRGYKLAFDFSHRIRINKICYFPRNDGNFITPGDIYELSYYNKKWISLYKIKATSHVLIFNKIPSNALFILKDLSKGNEERIFTYYKGKQHWW